MRLLITGSREWTNEAAIWSALAAYVQYRPVLVHGACRGADTIAANHWELLGLPTEPHPANWSRYGRKRAGPIRNAQMVQLGADWCLAFILNESPGSTHCVDLCHRAGIPTTIYKERKCQPIGSDPSKSKHANTTRKSTPTTLPTYSPGVEPKP